MNIVLVGPQGAGKGTQAQKIVAKYAFFSFEAGKELRRVAKTPTPLGRQIDKVLRSGRLISNELVYFLVKDWLDEVPPGKNMLFDGYPRRQEQLADLERLLDEKGQSINHVFSLTVSDQTATRRLMSRLLCPEEHIFNEVSLPPKHQGVCDYDNLPLSKRPDENLQAIKERLLLFHQETEPLIKIWTQETILTPVDAAKSIDEVWYQIDQVISAFFTDDKKEISPRT